MKSRYTAVIVAVGIVLTALPWGMLLMLNHGPFTIPPELIDDSIYYYSRLETVVHGHPFIGNPYFKKHADAMASAFFGADWVASVPLLLHIPLVMAAFISLVLSTAIFMLLSLWLLRRLGLTSYWQMTGAFALLLAAYWLLLRPVAMQVVFPAFLLFLIGYFLWLENPSSKKRIALLIVSSAVTFYLYTYLWQIVTIVIGLTHLLLLTPARKRYFSLVVADLVIGALIAPIVWYTYVQLQNPDYWATVTRIGYIATHTFGSAGLINLGLVMLALLFLFSSSKSHLTGPKVLFFTLTGAALVIATFSNVLTGKDLETAVHIGRFVELWAMLVMVYAVYAWSVHRHFPRPIAVALPVIICLVLVGNLWPIYKNSDTSLAGERYAEILAYIRSLPSGTVVLADDALANYIPAATNAYVVFQPSGGLYLMPDQEVEDRYLVSRLFTGLTEEQIKNDFRKYAGVGNAVHHYKVHNREALLCRTLHLPNCKSPVANALEERGDAYFDELNERYTAFKSAASAALEKYDVSYVLIPDGTPKPDGMNCDVRIAPYAICTPHPAP